jgi:hypothetical protein
MSHRDDDGWLPLPPRDYPLLTAYVTLSAWVTLLVLILEVWS